MRILAVKIKPSGVLADAKISRVKYCMYFRSLDWEHHREWLFTHLIDIYYIPIQKSNQPLLMFQLTNSSLILKESMPVD